MSLRVTVDLNTCQGYVCCVMEAPEVFDIDDDAGKAVLLQEQPSDALRGKVEAAARACPARAIRVDQD
jgi:ferredoxin